MGSAEMVMTKTEGLALQSSSPSCKFWRVGVLKETNKETNKLGENLKAVPNDYGAQQMNSEEEGEILLSCNSCMKVSTRTLRILVS